MNESRPPLPDSYEGLLNRARISFREGDVENAISLYRRLVDKLERLSDRILARRPELGDMHRQARLELTGLLHSEGRYAEAIEVEEVLLKSHPDDADTWRTDLAVLRVSKGEVDIGLAELQTLAEEHPDRPDWWILLAGETRAEGRFVESQGALEQALAAADPENQEHQSEIGYQRFLLFKDLGQLDDAAACWDKAVELDSERGRSVREVYTMFTEAGRYGDASRYVARDENALQSGLQRGIIANLTGDLSKARQEWEGVARLQPDDYEYGHDAWVESVLRLGDPEPALGWLQDALRRYMSPRLLVLSGMAWAMRDDDELASSLFQQAINMLRRGRPPKNKLDSTDWRLLDSVVTKTESKAPLKKYFAVIETLWA